MTTTLKFLLALPLAAFLTACPLEESSTSKTTKYTVGGTVTGLAAGQVVSLKLFMNGGVADFKDVNGSNSFTFGPEFKKGDAYEIVVHAQPRGANCTIGNASSGQVSSSNVTSVTVTCVPEGLLVFATLEMTGTVGAYRIGAGSGELTAVGTPLSTGSGTFPAPKGIAVDPTGKFVYVTNEGITTVATYSIDTGTGALRSVGTTSTSAGPVGVVVDPAGKFVYVAESGAKKISTYSVNATTGALTYANSSTSFAENAARPLNLAVAPSGNFLYYADGYNGYAGVLRVDRTTGALTELSFWNGFVETTNQIVVHPAGKFAFLAIGEFETEIGHIVVFSLDAVTGGMVRSSTVNITGVVQGVAVDPSGKYLYAIDNKNNLIYAYTINATTGALTTIGSAIATGSGPKAVVVERGGKYVYVNNSSSHSISAYTINETTGALTPTGAIKTGANTQPEAMATY